MIKYSCSQVLAFYPYFCPTPAGYECTTSWFWTILPCLHCEQAHLTRKPLIIHAYNVSVTCNMQKEPRDVELMCVTCFGSTSVHTEQWLRLTMVSMPFGPLCLLLIINTSTRRVAIPDQHFSLLKLCLQT